MPFPIAQPHSRRAFLGHGLKLSATAALISPSLTPAQPQRQPSNKIKICLSPGSIGVSAKQIESIALAEKHGFDAVEPFGGFLASLSDQQINDLVALLQSNQLAWGAAGLPVNFRQDEAKFKDGLAGLPKVAEALAKAGAHRVGTWLSPADNSLTYLQSMRQHARRLKEISRVLNDHGQLLGLEYVGTHTLRNRRKFPFVHTLAETKDLIGETGADNIGFILDSWHWWQAGDTVEDILSLKNHQVVSVDLNDAPLNVFKDQQIDGRRELPRATDVIDLKTFLKALEQIGYDGPARAEPFNRKLNGLDNDAACAATIQAMRKALELIG